MDVRDMTPAQLRAMADEKEARSGGITADEHERRLSVVRGEAPEEAPTEVPADTTVRHAVVDGIEIDVDMRTIMDIRTMRIIGRARKGSDEDATFAAIELFDRLLGDQRERVERELSDADGFCPVERYVSFAMRLFEEVGAKN